MPEALATNVTYPNLKPQTKHHRGNQPGRKSAYSQAVEAQDLVMADIRNPKTKPSIRAGLCRAWDVLEERKRILRGCPLPGQLRPDLDPVQLSRALKRHRDRGSILMPKSMGLIGPIEAIPPTSAKVSEDETAKGQTTSESLPQDQDGTGDTGNA